MSVIDSRQMQQLAEVVDRYSNGDGLHDTAIPGMRCLRFSDRQAAIPGVYSPCVCVIAQGAKEVLVEEDTYRYAPSQYLVVSVDLPVVSQITQASAAEPYLCLHLEIDAHELTELITQMRQTSNAGEADGETMRGIFVGSLDAALLESILRLVRLLESPGDIPLLAPMAKREVYYRLLAGEHGGRIAQLGVPDSSMQRIVRVLQVLKTNFTKAIRVEELAEIASMSASAFHHHFKQVTALSPLQYQKRLRLMEARRILLTQEADAASTAYRVGYESPSQFSREYARMFGAPPMRDVYQLKSRGISAAGS